MTQTMILRYTNVIVSVIFKIFFILFLIDALYVVKEAILDASTYKRANTVPSCLFSYTFHFL